MILLRDFFYNKEAMDKEAASCQTKAAEQSPDDNMAEGRANVSDRSIKEAMGKEEAAGPERHRGGRRGGRRRGPRLR